MTTPKTDDAVFEDEVRRIARELWPASEYSGASMIDGRETDGVFVTDDCINIIETTTSREKKKAIYDGEKLLSLAKKYSKGSGDRAIRCFFITKYEPTAEQRLALKELSPDINPLQYAQFQQKLVNASEYLDLRANYAFGSARDPKTDSIHPESKYIDLDLLDVKNRQTWSLEKVKNSLLTGSRICLLGDYGAGKSMTLKEVFKLLRRDFVKGNVVKFPIYINLRDHQGQTEPAEVLLRHSNSVGFKHYDHLIRAWRAGYVVLILDGFDEMGTVGWTGQWKKLRDLRQRAMEVIRRFHRDTPHTAGVISAGRAHYFDNDSERRSALALNSNSVDLSLSDFSDGQISEYLNSFGVRSQIPSWLPKRPLLLGYLASKGLIGELITDAEGTDFANDASVGWDMLIGKISEREANIEAGIDGLALRRVIERIATKARSTSDGIGPIYQKELSDAFFEICGYQPNDAAMILLQRLPGLGTKSDAEESRIFIHEDLTDVCRVGDVLSFVIDPFTFPIRTLENIECLLGDIGQQVLACKVKQHNLSEGLIDAGLTILINRDKCNAVVADLAINELGRNVVRRNPVSVRGVSIKVLNLEELNIDASNYEFQDCFITRIEMPQDDTGAMYPKFYSTYVGELVGRVSLTDAPAYMFDDKCVIESFESSVGTLKDIMDLDLPMGQRVMLSVLKKLYIQRGSGRKENALFRGLSGEAKRVVPDVLHALQSDRLVYQTKHAGVNIWYPIRGQTRRVYTILSSPGSTRDPVFRTAAMFSS